MKNLSRADHQLSYLWQIGLEPISGSWLENLHTVARHFRKVENGSLRATADFLPYLESLLITVDYRHGLR